MTDPRACPHETSEPVDVRTRATGAVETVARICTACLAQLPAAWGCTRCEWAEERRLCDIQPTRTLTRPCQEHA